MNKEEDEKNIDKIDKGTLYQSMNAGINFIKSQQWNIAYYSLLMLGAIIGAFKLLWESMDQVSLDSLQWMRIVFALLAIFASILILRVSNKLYENYETDLKKKQGIIDKFSDGRENYSNAVIKVFEDYPEVEDEFNKRPDIGIRNTNFIVGLHRKILLIGAIFSIFYFSLKLFTYLNLWRDVKMENSVVALLFILGNEKCKFKLKKLEYKTELAKLMINRIDKIEEYTRNKEMDGLSIIITGDLSKNNITFTIKEAEKKIDK